MRRVGSSSTQAHSDSLTFSLDHTTWCSLFHPRPTQDQEALLGGGYSSEEELLAQPRARCARDAPKGKDKEQVSPQAPMANAKQVIMVRCSNAECASTLKAQVALSSGSVSLCCPSCSTVTPYQIATSTARGLCVD